MKRILITGGAGFIGSHLVDSLLNLNHDVIVYDNLEPQVHGNITDPPKYLANKIEFIKGDIRDRNLLSDTLKDVEVVFHLAASVGVSQSMYQISKYLEVNTYGTAVLLDILVNSPNNVEKLIVASSMSIYGEGSYHCSSCEVVNPKIRTQLQLENQDWELNCPVCGKKIKPIPTDEKSVQKCTSIYALTKKEQEKMCLMIGKTYGINTTSLRLFNVYGSRQAMSNPYTGVCAIFSTRLLHGNPPSIYEDGKQTRDFIHVKDICQALILSMEKKQANYEVFNVGTGKPITILEIAEILSDYINPKIEPLITNKYRSGDIRHCYADISKIKSKLGFKPKYSFKKGINELMEWIKLQVGKVVDKQHIANQELRKRGLIK